MDINDMYNENLLKETIETLRQHNKSLDDVEWFGWSDRYMPLKRIREILDVEYYAGFGEVEISPTLIICGKDWWLERDSYDGSEWWEYKEQLKKPKAKATNFNISYNKY